MCRTEIFPLLFASTVYMNVTLTHGFICILLVDVNEYDDIVDMKVQCAKQAPILIISASAMYCSICRFSYYHNPQEGDDADER